MTTPLSHPAIDVIVEGPLPDVKWLGLFLHPALRLVSGGRRDGPVVRFEPPGAGRPVPGQQSRTRVAFVLDRGPVLMSETATSDGACLADPQNGIAFSRRDSPLSVVVHSGPSPAASRVAFMRVVREFTHNATIDCGGAVFHSAAVVAEQGALMLLGPKGSGKTTTLARLLALDGIDYLSNDRVALFPPMPGPPSVIPMATIVGVRKGTRTLLPGLAASLASLPSFTDDTDAPAPARSDTGTWYFSPRQFARALSRDVKRIARVAAVVVLRGFGPLSSQRLDRAAALDAVRSAVLGHDAGHVTSDVFRAGPMRANPLASIDAVCEHLVSHVPVFGVTVPPQPDPGSFEAMVRSWR